MARPGRSPSAAVGVPPWERPSAILALTAAALLACGPAAAPCVIWNSSPSSPRGLYVLAAATYDIGDFVAAWPPGPAAKLAYARGYLRAGVPLVKTVAAARGDVVCTKGVELSVNGRALARRRLVDRAGRALPHRAGCRTLGPGEILLLGLGHAASFDGRYFGPVAADRIIGRAWLVWRA